ncbi:MAG: polyphosphate polymerase domain-containing protein [Lachnospiraceae bacterium]
MAQAVFNRVEKKYLLTPEQYRLLRERIDAYLTEDRYSQYTIRNIYFDNDTDELIRTSIEKPDYKEKFRIRCYDRPDENSNVFLEIKKKCTGVVNKRRIILPYVQAKQFLKTGKAEGADPQITKEINYVITHYGLYPKLYLAYDRLAYFATEDPSFRITFDYNIRSRRENLILSSDEDTELLLEPGYMLMEVKIHNAMPLWFVNILSELEIRNISFSKYGTIYKNELIRKRGTNFGRNSSVISQWNLNNSEYADSILVCPCSGDHGSADLLNLY